MFEQLFGKVGNGAIGFFLGTCLALLGFRVIGKRPGVSAQYDDWHRRRGWYLKWAGPLFALYGLVIMITSIGGVSRSPGSPHVVQWARYTTSDGVCSAEFPGQPVQEATTSFGIAFNQWKLSLPDQDILYMLAFSDIPADAAPASDEQRLDAVRDGMPTVGSRLGMKYEFRHEERIVQNGVPGRCWEFSAGEASTIWMKVFIRGRRGYRVIAAVPRSTQVDDVTTRFLRSFRFEQGQ